MDQKIAHVLRLAAWLVIGMVVKAALAADSPPIADFFRRPVVTGVLVLPQRQTVLVAKQVASIDLLSGGRIRLAVGVGWNSVEYEALGADFVGFTGHKMLGPSGIGGLWARRELLEAMPPFLGGGEMIRDVTKEGFTPNDVPWKFEAGTPPIAEAVVSVDPTWKTQMASGSPAASSVSVPVNCASAAVTGSSW